MFRTCGNHAKPNGRELDHEGEAIARPQSFSALLVCKTDDGNRKTHLPRP